jgi:biotin carboxylase
MHSELNGKKLLVLGGMKISCEIVRKAKEMGVYVAVTDYNLPEESPAKQIADESFMVSTTDVDAVVDLIKKEKFDGVLTGFVDLLLPYYAEICNKASLPSLATKEQYEVYIEKKKYKALLKKFGVPVPEEYVINDMTDEQLSSIRYPVIVKPADSSGARGIQVCEKREELESAFSDALRFSKTGSVIVEQFLRGVEVTAFWMMQDGEPYFIGLGNRHVEKNQGPDVTALPVGYTYPSIHTKRYIDEIAPKMEKMIKGSGIENGLLFLQCVVEDGIPKVYDLGLRLTGSLEYYMFEKMCGYNPMEMLIRFAITGSEGESIKDRVDPYLNGRYGWNISFLMKPGIIAKIIGYEEIRRVPGVIDAVIAHEVGEEIKLSDRGLLKQICCRVLGHSDTVDEMRDMINKVTSIYQVLDANGESLLLPVLDIDKYRDTVI